MTTIAQLRERITPLQQELLTEIVEAFLSTGRGCVVVRFHLQHIQAGHPKEEIIAALEAMGGSVVFEMEEYQPSNRYQPTFLGLLLSMRGAEFEGLLARYLDFALDRALRDPDQAPITHVQAEEALSITKAELALLGRLLNAGHFYGVSSASTGDFATWQVQILKEVDDLPSFPSKLAYVHHVALRGYDPNAPVTHAKRIAYHYGAPIASGRGIPLPADDVIPFASLDLLGHNGAMPAVSAFDSSVLESICDVLGDTETGLSGTEIAKHLSNVGIADKMPGITKRTRLFEALKARQLQDRCGNNVVAFIRDVMSPVRHAASREWFDAKRAELNTVLAFAGYELGDDGELRTRTAARTIDQAEERAQNLRRELQRRGVHGDVLRFCTAELIKDDYFHAVLEATKSVAQKLRDKTGLSGDGGDLATQALALGQSGMPFLAFNSLQTDSERSEQKGLLNLAVGMFGTFRNTTAHAPRINWQMSEQDALDLLTMASFLHRRLDSAVRTPRQPQL